MRRFTGLPSGSLRSSRTASLPMIWQGWFAYTEGRLQAAARFYERAIAIDPNNTSLLRVLVSFLTSIGRADEAVAVGRYLLLRDPACAVCIGNLAFALRAAGKPEDSVEALEAILAWHTPRPGFYWTLGVSCLIAGQPQRALDTFELESLDGNREMGIIMALHDLGRFEEFESRLAQLHEDTGGYEAIARIYAWAGNADKAFEWLYRMVEMEGPSMLGHIDTDLYSRIKSDPRWRELRSKYGFEERVPESIEFNFTLPSGASLPDRGSSP